MNVVYAQRALRDLENIETYLLGRSPTGARNVLAAVHSSIVAVAAFPKIGRLVDRMEHRRISRCCDIRM